MAKINASIKDKIKDRLKIFKKNPWFRYLNSEKNRILANRLVKKYSDEVYIKKLFKKAFNYELDLNNPITFNEKLQWLKLNNKIPEMAVAADKYEVRDYLQNKGYASLLNELFGVYDNPESIDFENLPDKFIIKATHGSGWNILCLNKNNMNWSAWRKVMKSWLKQNLYVYGREWVYKDMKPRIIIEKFLKVENGELFDYKFFCLNGNVEFIQVTDNDPKTAKINLYTTDWELMKEKYAFIGSPKKINKPQTLSKMIEIAVDLSKPFPFARIDLYDVDGKIVFGEITFFPSSGFKVFDPLNMI